MIIIDDGHGANTPGKRSPFFEEDTYTDLGYYCAGTQFRENTFNAAVAEKLEYKLKTLGFMAFQLVPSDVDMPLSRRVEKVNNIANSDDLLISIHANAHEPEGQGLIWNEAHGVETFYYTHSQASKQVAEIIHPSFAKASGRRDRGIKPANFYILKHTRCKAILIEGGFMTNREECLLLASDEYIDRIVEGIAEGIQIYNHKLLV